MEGRVVHERVLPAELFVDEVEAQTGDPRQLHQIKLVDDDLKQRRELEQETKLIHPVPPRTIDS